MADSNSFLFVLARLIKVDGMPKICAEVGIGKDHLFHIGLVK